MDVERAFPNLSFSRMVFLTPSGDGTDRLFLVLQPGRIMVFPNQETVDDAQLFLDIRDRVNDRGNEEGLLGLAFDPDYASNGFFYIYYSASNPRRSVISRAGQEQTVGLGLVQRNSVGRPIRRPPARPILSGKPRPMIWPTIFFCVPSWADI